MSLPNYYEVLGIARTFETADIPALRKSLARRYHPDGSEPDAERMAKINDACDVLGDEDLRKQYDREFADQVATAEAEARAAQAEADKRQRAPSAAQAANVGNAFRAQAGPPRNPSTGATSRPGGLGDFGHGIGVHIFPEQ